MQHYYIIMAYDTQDNSFSVVSNDGTVALQVRIPINIAPECMIGKTFTVSYMKPLTAEPVGYKLD